MIAIEDLEFRYGEAGFRLRISRLAIERGSKVALVGPSGSGKTTLLHLIAGILVPGQGRIRVADVDLPKLGDAARRNFRIARIGLVFQDFELIEYLNVRENILLPYLINGSLKLDARARRAAAELAASMGLGDKLGRPIGQLSHGEKQRAAICRALLPGPETLLADEPTGNLDTVNKRRIMKILFDHARQTRATLLVVTHDLSLLEGFQRVVDLQDFVAPQNNRVEG